MDTSYARRARADSSRAPRFRRAQVAIGALLALLLAATVTTAVAAQQGRKAGSCRCEVTKRFERAYDELLKLAARERRASALKHLPWGVPVNAPGATNEQLDRTLVRYRLDGVLHTVRQPEPFWGKRSPAGA